MTEGGDIVLKVFYQKDGQQADLLLSEKVESHLSFEEGQILCDFTGKCITHSINVVLHFTFV